MVGFYAQATGVAFNLSLSLSLSFSLYVYNIILLYYMMHESLRAVVRV